jgi:hypothetical protein
MRHFLSSLATALFLTASTSFGAADRPFFSPVIQSEMDAIGVAHALYTARARTQPMASTKNVAFWRKNFSANYSNGVWVVKSRSRYSTDVAGISIRIAAQDGRLLGLVYCGNAVCSGVGVGPSVPVGHWSFNR